MQIVWLTSTPGRPAHSWATMDARECRVLALSVPVSASEVLSFGSYLITTAQVGHLGSLELSAVVLGRSVYHITGLSL